MRRAFSVGRQRLPLAGLASVITLVEAVSGAVAWILLISFASFYTVEEYSRLFPWLACQQLIIVLAPFGAGNILSKVMLQGATRESTELYAYIPRYVLSNLLFAVPLSWALTWFATHNSFAAPHPVEALLVVTTGAWLASQRTQQQLAILRGRRAEYTRERTIGGLMHLILSLVLARLQLPSIGAFVGGQVGGLIAVECLRGIRTSVSSYQGSKSFYSELLKRGWVFGVWSIFGWFSGLGGTVLLTRTTEPEQIAVYGEAVAVISLIALGLGGAATAIQADLLGRRADWSGAIQRKLDRLYNFSSLFIAGVASLATTFRLENLAIFHRIGLSWPPYIWFYFYLTYVSLTLYQRVMIRHQYDTTVSLSFAAVACSEVLAIVGFAVVLSQVPDHPLWAQTALVAGRCMTLFALAAPHGRSAWLMKCRTLGTATGLAIVLLFVFWTINAHS